METVALCGTDRSETIVTFLRRDTIRYCDRFPSSPRPINWKWCRSLFEQRVPSNGARFPIAFTRQACTIYSIIKPTFLPSITFSSIDPSQTFFSSFYIESFQKFLLTLGIFFTRTRLITGFADDCRHCQRKRALIDIVNLFVFAKYDGYQNETKEENKNISVCRGSSICSYTSRRKYTVQL